MHADEKFKKTLKFATKSGLHNPYIFPAQSLRPCIIQTIISVGSNCRSLHAIRLLRSNCRSLHAIRLLRSRDDKI